MSEHRSTSKARVAQDTRASMKQMLLPIDLSDAQYRILFILFLHANENGECFLSQKDMMRFMKLGKTAVWNACKELEAKGLIERNKKNHISGEKPLATEYRFLWGRFATVDLGHVRPGEPGQVRDGEVQEPYEEPSSKNPKEEKEEVESNNVEEVPVIKRKVVRNKKTKNTRGKISSRNSLRNGVNKKPKGQVHVGEPGPRPPDGHDLGPAKNWLQKQNLTYEAPIQSATRWDEEESWL